MSELPAEKAFVLQLTRDTDPTLASFAGRIEHLSTGRRLRFQRADEFLSALRALLEEAQRSLRHRKAEVAKE